MCSRRSLRGRRGSLQGGASPFKPHALEAEDEEGPSSAQRFSRRVTTHCTPLVPRIRSLVFSGLKPLEKRRVAGPRRDAQDSLQRTRKSPRGGAVFGGGAGPRREAQLVTGRAGPHGEAQALMATHSVLNLTPGQLRHVTRITRKISFFSMDQHVVGMCFRRSTMEEAQVPMGRRGFSLLITIALVEKSTEREAQVPSSPRPLEAEDEEDPSWQSFQAAE